MSEEDDIEAHLRGDPMPQPKYRNQSNRDDESSLPHARMAEPKFSFFFQWLSGIAAVLVCSGIAWIGQVSLTTAGDVKVLLSRPEPVTMAQYKSDQTQLQRQLEELKTQINLIRAQK